MKQFLISLIAFVCAMAANAVEPAKGTAVLSGSSTELTPLEVTAGKSIKTFMWIDIQETQDFAGIEADLYLPEGVEVVGGKESTLTRGEDEFGELFATHAITTSLNTDGSYKIKISGSMPLGGKRGSVAQINLKVAASFEGGMAQFKNVIFGCASTPSPFDATNGIDCDQFAVKEKDHPAPGATVEVYLPTNEKGVAKTEWVAESNPAGNIVDIDATPSVHLYAFSGPESGWTEGETLPLTPVYNNGWAVKNNRNNIWDEALQATKTLYFVNGAGIPTTGVAFAMKYSDDMPTGQYRACYDKQKDPNGPWYAEDGITPITTDFDFYYKPDGTTAVPKYGTYYKVISKLDGTIKILVWNNKGSHPVYVVDNDTRVALNPLAGEVKYSGYVNGKDEYIDPLDDTKGKKMKFYENLVPQEGKVYVPQAEVNANQAAWVYLTFTAKANKTYWVFGGDAQLGFGGLEFTAEKAPQATVYYSQDYENGAEADWSTQVGGRFDPEIGEDAGGNHYLRAAAGTRTSNGTGMYSNAYSDKLAAGTPFTMTADIRLRSANGQNGVEFAVGAAGASYSFSKWALTGTMTLNMKQVATGGTDQWILNGDTDNPITLPGTGALAGTNAADVYDAAPWYSIQLTWQDGLTLFSIKNKATGEVIVDKKQLKNNDSFASVGGVGQLWFSTSRYNAAFAIDNVVIRDIIDEDLPGVVAPTKNAVAIKIDDKRSSQDGYYAWRATIEEPEDGDADGYIMLVSEGAEPDKSPVDGVAYAKGDTLGISKIYSTSGTVNNLYGMEPGVYYAKAFAYKNSANGPKYLIEGAPMAYIATPKAGTTAPDSLWVRSTAATSIGLGVKGNAAGQTIIVAACDSTYNPGNYGTRPYPGNLSATSKKNDPILDENGNQVGKVVYVGVPTPGSGTTFTASSLKASTPYYFVAYASDGEQLAWDPDFLQVWATTEITVPYTVAMDKAPENNQPVGWTSEPSGEYEGFFVQKANMGGDDLHPTQIPVLQGTNTHFETNDWTASLTSPEVTLTKDCKYTFKWRMDEKGMNGMTGAGHGPGNWAEEGEYLKFEVICDGETTLAKNYTYENAPECLANKEWVNEVIDLSAYSGKKVQVKMTWRCEFAGGVDMYLDNMTFEQHAVTPTKVPSLSFAKKHLSGSFELTADIVQPAEPDADGYVMLVSKNAAPTVTPVEGVTYKDEDVLGNAIVSIHSGRSMSKNISPIEEGATYYVTAYPYNTGNGGPKYLIEGAPLASVVIPTADLAAPAAIKALDEQKYTDKISFSVTANAANQTVIVAYNDSTCNPGNYGSLAAVGEINPATAKAGDQLYDASGNPCGKIAYVGATGEFTVEGLLPSTSYYFTAFSANDKAVSWSPDYINCWAATKGVAPYEVNMAAAPVRDLPAGWATTPKGENKGFYKQSLSKNLPPSGNPNVFYSTAPNALEEDTHTATLTSPIIALTKDNTLSFDWLTVKYGRFSNTAYGPGLWTEEDTVKVELIDGENVVELKSYNMETAPVCLDIMEYVSEDIDLSAYAGKDVQFRIIWHSLASSQVYMYLDAFKVNAPESPTEHNHITANVNDETMGSVSIAGEGAIGTTVTLTANANEGYRFTRWTDADGVTVSTDNPWTLTLAGDTTVTANFVPLLNVEVQEEVDVPAITYDYSLGYAGGSGTFDISMVYDAIGCNADEAIVFGYDPTTGDYLSDAMSNCDGFFSADGVPTAWDDSTTPFCIKFYNDGTFWYCTHPDVVEYGVTYTCAWLLVNPETGDAVQYNFSMNDSTTGINSIDVKSVKSGKYLEYDKIVIIKSGVKYDVTGF